MKGEDTFLHIEVDGGKFYIYDKLSSGNCICYGWFDSRKEADNELKRLIKIEKSQVIDKKNAA